MDAFAFIPAQVRPQVGRLVERCIFCGGSGVDPQHDNDAIMSACGACNGSGLTMRIDAADEVLPLHAALESIAKSVEVTPWIEHLKPEGTIEVRLSAKQIAAMRAALANCAVPPTATANPTATAVTPATEAL